LAPGQTATATVDWGDGKIEETYIVNQTSIFIERKFDYPPKDYEIKCNIIETGSLMTERVTIRRNLEENIINFIETRF